MIESNAAGNNVQLHAGLARRTAAFFIDTTVVIIAGLFFFWLIFNFIIGSQFTANGIESGVNSSVAAGNSLVEKITGGIFMGLFGAIFGSLVAMAVSFFLGFIISGTIEIFVEGITGNSAGKLLLGMRVVLSDGAGADIGHRLLRTLYKYSFMILCAAGILTGTSAIFFAGLVLALVIGVGCFFVSGKNRLSLHDRLSGTAVIRKA